MTRGVSTALLLTASFVFLSAGCSRNSLESSVIGKVTLDGKPIGPGTVVFSSGAKNPAIGAIDVGGNYSLKTSRTEGLAAGRYRVAVSVREVPPNSNPSDRLPPGKLLHPEKYEAVETSGLEFDVVTGSNTIDLPLTSQ
jgi:hypothetical protein